LRRPGSDRGGKKPRPKPGSLEVNADAGWIFKKGRDRFRGAAPVVHINAGIAGLVGARW